MNSDYKINATAVLADGAATSNGETPSVIAGYELESRIGVGGYGEVWKAIGPGGLPKAVKILFGQMDGPQADVELKSLERVRDLRHPFLLNIERIEVCDGKLIVVAELADGCLDDRFRDCKSDGLRGIPRDELLGYLRDAADALDFMFDQHRLQHLDIKPENLLLQGGHVKVGDFGLTKEVKHTSVSVVGGFTPLYAPPELFEGQPSRTSDQYSLAIVYQTMLTGVPPFAGRTAAQLTAQHLKSTPDLSTLQPVDRPVVARALSKNPNARFTSCRQFVDELGKRRNARVRATPRVEANVRKSNTEVVDTGRIETDAKRPEQASRPVSPPSEPGKTTWRPTLYVGVGGLGGKTLQILRQTQLAAFPEARLASFPLLYIDSDRQAVSQASLQGENSLRVQETLAIPLRSSQEFRSAASQVHLGWLSRRWLYNIPRSGQVEGIRPLGRLALVDRHELVRERLTDMIKLAMSQEAVDAASEDTGLQIDAKLLDVVIVAGISGGTGGGSCIDVSYLIQEICFDLGVDIGRQVGMLMHSTVAARQTSDLQQANTLSLLAELDHFSLPGAGGPRGLTDHPALADRPPFDHAYVVHLGDGLPAMGFEEQTRKVAEYIWNSTLTNARGTVEQWRKLADEKLEDELTLRTFGLTGVDAAAYRRRNEQARALCQAVTSLRDDRDAMEEVATELLMRMRLNDSALSGKVVETLRGKAGHIIEDISREIWQNLGADTALNVDRENLFNKISDRLTACSSNDEGTGWFQSIVGSVRSEMAGTVDNVLDTIRERVFSRIDELNGPGRAKLLLDSISRQLKSATETCVKLLEDVEAKSQRLADQHPIELDDETETDADRLDALEGECHQYCLLRSYETIYWWFVSHLNAVVQGTQEIEAELGALQKKLAELNEHFASDEDIEPAWISAFEHLLLSRGTIWLSTLSADDWDVAVAAENMFEAALEYLASSGQEDRSDAFPNNAWPTLQKVGGDRRVFAVLSDSVSSDRWARQLIDEYGDCVTVHSKDCERLTVVCEVEGLPISRVREQFTHHNPQLAEIANRLHVRNDVDWQ